MSIADKYITVLQARFPNVKITWEIPPHPFFDTQVCVLTFTSKTDSTKTFELRFPEGLGIDPTEQDIESFIIMNAEELDAM